MSWRDAPVYVEAVDLARTVQDRVADWSGPNATALAGPTVAAALALVEAIALALTFPDTRAEQLRAADEAVVRLCERLRLAERLGLLSARALRHAAARLQPIGRMIGGWRKRVGPLAREPPPVF